MTEDWPETWDYKRLSHDGEHVVAYATGPQHVCKGVRIRNSEFLQPDTGTMQKVFSEARAIKAVPVMLAELRETADFLVMQFAQAVDPDNPKGWSEPDAYERYKGIHAAIAKAEGRT